MTNATEHFFGSGPFLTTIKAMRALGLPAILADMTLLPSLVALRPPRR